MTIETLDVSFPGGKRVDASIGGFTIRTDQSAKGGGEGSAPEPFDLFLASIATCAGIFALGFCQSRNLSTEGLSLRMECEKDPVKKLFAHMRFHLTLPRDFPDKHRASIERAIGMCTVKRHITDAELPAFEVVFEN
jgi:uncharacterized OsmC-like protein